MNILIKLASSVCTTSVWKSILGNNEDNKFDLLTTNRK